MASQESTGGDFQSRVDKIFGSLSFAQQPPSSSSPSPQLHPRPSSLWSLKDGDVEKREWRRDQSSSYARDQTPCSSSFDDLVKEMQRNSRNTKKQTDDDLRDLDEEDDQMRGEDENIDDDEDVEDWSIRASIGLDPTLDNEEEEDEYDKLALGRENAGDRLYMKDITDQGTSLGSISGHRKSSGRATRDPRANHLAAKARLKEDEAETQSSSFHRDDIPESKGSPRTEPSKDVFQPKPILKRKDNSSETKPSKRVRFDLASTDGEEASGEFEDNSSRPENSSASDRESPRPQNGSQIPDFLQNPSKYTRYSFESSSDFDEKANSQAYLDHMKLVQDSKSEIESSSNGVPKRIPFTPQKKSKGVKEEENVCETKEDSSALNETGEDKKPVAHSVGITAVSTQEVEVNMTEEDEAELGAMEGTLGSGKPSRHYRSKPRFKSYHKHVILSTIYYLVPSTYSLILMESVMKSLKYLLMNRVRFSIIP